MNARGVKPISLRHTHAQSLSGGRRTIFGDVMCLSLVMWAIKRILMRCRQRARVLKYRCVRLGLGCFGYLFMIFFLCVAKSANLLYTPNFNVNLDIKTKMECQEIKWSKRVERCGNEYLKYLLGESFAHCSLLC